MTTYKIGAKFKSKINNCLCTLIEKAKDGFACTYILQDDEGTSFSVFGRVLERDFVVEK